MGGDFAPESILQGAILSLDFLAEDELLVLFGKKALIESYFYDNHLENQNKIEIVDCHEIIEMGDDPVKSFLEKSNSSIVKGFLYLKQGLIDSFASAGNTGAMLVGATKVITSVNGILRPCISSLVPNDKGKNNLLLDVGINADPKPEQLLQYAKLANIFARNILDIDDPKIGLLNIGEEENKGNILAKATYQLFKTSKEINFVGNIEGSDIFSSDKVDVIITDGFTGNIVLKVAESFYELLKRRNISDSYFDNFNYENYGGTPILGISQPVIVGHGKSSSEAIKNMILLSRDIVKKKLLEEIIKEFNHD